MWFSKLVSGGKSETQKTPADVYIPCGDIPLNGPQPHYVVHRGQEVEWLGYDSYARFLEVGGHPVLGEHDITYKLNSYGYRCPEFDTKADIRVLSIGCSIVFGKGLPRETIFHERICQRLRGQLGRSVVNFNLGSGGASNDYIMRTLYLAVPLLRPHVVMIGFTGSERREYIDASGGWMKFGPNNLVSWYDKVHQELYHGFMNLLSHWDQQRQSFLHYKGTEGFLRDTCWACSFINQGERDILGLHVDENHCAGAISQIDTARDHAHPGPESHRILADEYWRKLTANGGLERLERTVRSDAKEDFSPHPN